MFNHTYYNSRYELADFDRIEAAAIRSDTERALFFEDSFSPFRALDQFNYPLFRFAFSCLWPYVNPSFRLHSNRPR